MPSDEHEPGRTTWVAVSRRVRTWIVALAFPLLALHEWMQGRRMAAAAVALIGAGIWSDFEGWASLERMRRQRYAELSRRARVGMVAALVGTAILLWETAIRGWIDALR
jgi:hypothetical protein